MGLLLAPPHAAEAAPAASGNVYVVTSTGGGGGGGAGCSAEFCLLRDAVQSAEASPGGDANRVAVVARGAQVELVGLTLADGLALGGGAIRNEGRLTLVAGVVQDSVSLSGPGVSGGGISSSATATIDESEVSGNSAAVGGGGIDNSGSMTLRRSTVHGNEADGEGGGIVNFRFAGTASLSVESSTISENSVAGIGGGISNFGALILHNSTVTANLGSDVGPIGGGLYLTGDATLQNTVVAGNRGNSLGQFSADCSLIAGGRVTSLGGNVFGVDTGCKGAKVADHSVDPLTVAATVFFPLTDTGGLTPTNALRWSATNLAIDIGGVCPAVDQRGFRRPVDGPDPDSVAACDCGSVEAAASVEARVAVTANAGIAVLPVGGSDVLTVTVGAKNVTDQTRTRDLWRTTTEPTGAVVSTQVVRDAVVAAGRTVSRAITAQFLGPAGLYRVDTFVGDYDAGVVVGSDALAVSKAGQS